VNPIEDAHVLDKVLFKVDAVILILPDDDSMILKSNDRVKICRKETLVIIFWHSSATSCKMATYIDVYLKGIYVGTQHFCPNQLNKKHQISLRKTSRQDLPSHF